MNRLGSATSPYLLQHADNPVDWWPWCDEAFEQARRRDVPVMISVGYASCHWCHVMAHESFEDEQVAAALNDGFVSIKVDREERPDVDAVYMSATQAMTGQGGWPMTVFATPDGQPFYCGTYFPREQLLYLLSALSQAWRDQRSLVIQQGQQVVQAIGGAAAAKGQVPLTAQTLDDGAAKLADEYDETYGGFGAAPKFPPHMVLLWLLRHHQRTADARSLEMVRHTAEAMARGGVYDQVGGGFHRYAVDTTWTVPHFEKMLYDNALLLRAYTQIWRLTGDKMALRVARETVDFLLDDLRTPQGGFASALDADTPPDASGHGGEGVTYAWTPAQLAEALGPDEGAWVADLCGVTEAGTFEHGMSVLELKRDIDEVPEVLTRWLRARSRLRSVRAGRAQPMRDDKVIAAWNGLAVTALAEFGRLTGDDRAAQAALAAAQLLAGLHLVDGRLRRVSRDGTAGEPAGVLEDYGCVAEAFCALHQLTGDGQWLSRAGRLLDVALARFGTDSGGFFDTADDAEQLVTRPADPTDNATPSGLSAVVSAAIAYTALSGETTYRQAAERALGTVTPIIAGFPRFAGYAAMAAEAVLAGPFEVAVATTNGGHDALVRAAVEHAPAGAVVVSGSPDQPGVPLLAGRPMTDGRPTAYVCRGFVCDRPVTTVEELAAVLTR